MLHPLCLTQLVTSDLVGRRSSWLSPYSSQWKKFPSPYSFPWQSICVVNTRNINYMRLQMGGNMNVIPSKLSNHSCISCANFPNNLHSPKKTSYRIKLGKLRFMEKIPNGFHPHQNAIHAGHAYVTSFGWCIILNLSTTQIHLKQCMLGHPSKLCWKHIWSQAYMEQTNFQKEEQNQQNITLKMILTTTTL